MKETPEEIQKLLKTVCDQFDKEDQSTRERQIRLYKKLKLYWNGFQRVWWSEVAHDWRVDDNNSEQNNDAAYYDKPINIFRAYLESIIAALSISIPSVHCLPDDANDPLDISTAKAGNKIYELVSKHNDAPLLWLEGLYIFCTEGLVHCYNYTKEDESYGTYEDREFQQDEVETLICPYCNNEIPESALEIPEIDEMQMEGMDPEGYTPEMEEGPTCPSCGNPLDPSMEKTPIVIDRLVGVSKKAKSRQIIEVFGGLFVRTPTYAKKQCDMPYLCYSYETHYSLVIDRYKKLKEWLTTRSNNTDKGGYDSYERWGRLSTQYQGTFPDDMITVRNWWFRPSAFNVLDEDDAEKLKKLYPSGVRVVFANDHFAEAGNEALDDHWTLTKNPLSDYLQYDPLGLLLVSIQDITNDLTALTLQTIEQGIPQTFADPAVLDFKAYREQEATPGSVYPTKAVSASKNIGEAFTTLKTSSLSPEVLPFGIQVQSLGQVTSGALPSLFGGESSAGSKTASEYSMSRAQALQRLQNSWKMFSFWWKNIFGKVIPAYIKEVAEDEKFTKKDEQGNYINVFIRKAEVQGKIGDVELESSEQLPITWAQKRDMIKELFTMNVPGIIEALTSPENLPFVKDAFGLDDFVMPGENDRQKQYEEIQLLLEGEPTPISQPDPMTGMMMEGFQSSVPIDADIDDHLIHVDILKYWANSEMGRQIKIDNPSGYVNVLTHLKEHLDYMKQQVMQQMMAQAEMSGGSGESSESSKNGNGSKLGKGPSKPAQRGNDGKGLPIQ